MDKNSLDRARSMWKSRGQTRPPMAIEPGPGQESVWDYPRPPVIVPDTRLVEIKFAGTLIAETRAARRVLETASPPTVYLPPDAVKPGCLRAVPGHSFCEWKGQASYFNVCVNGHTASKAAWCYHEPFEAFAEIADYLAFYPGRVDCFVDGEHVQAQAGGFYGGWITREIVGPFKGETGTSGW